MHRIPKELWHRIVLADFLVLAQDCGVEGDPKGGKAYRPGLHAIAGTLREMGVLTPSLPPPPPVSPFIVPKSSAKVTLILPCVGMKELTGKPPHFDLPSWEKIPLFLAYAARGTQYYATHVDLSNAFVPCVMRPLEWELHGSANLTTFCCVLRKTWCHRVRFWCYLRQNRGTINVCKFHVFTSHLVEHIRWCSVES